MTRPAQERTGGHHGGHHGGHVPDIEEPERFWESHYRRAERVWSGRANPVLVEVAGSLPPGTALDLGCGEGGDAVWLARQGWRVTAVDLSVTALARAAEAAETAGMSERITYEQHDLARSSPAGPFDLVSAQYLQSPVAFPRERVLRAVAATVAPGGLLLIVDHASAPSWSWADPDTRWPTPQETLAPLELPPAQWRAERLEAASRRALGPEGQAGVVTDNVIAVRRLG